MQFQPSKYSGHVAAPLKVTRNPAQESRTNGALTTLASLGRNTATATVMAAGTVSGTVALGYALMLVRPLGGLGNFKRAAKWAAAFSALGAASVYYALGEVGEATGAAIEGDWL
jgi:hypothetical protein